MVDADAAAGLVMLLYNYSTCNWFALRIMWGCSGTNALSLAALL